MTISNLSKILATTVLAGFTFGAVAAESASGVAEHFNLLIESTKAAQAAASAGDKEGCQSNIKQAKQHYKELTGAAQSKAMQDAIKKMNDAKEDCVAGNTADAATKLGEVATVQASIQAATATK